MNLNQVISMASDSTSQATSPMFFSSDGIEKLIIAVVGAILGFLFNVVLARRKERREQKELSYELTIKNTITKEESPIKDNIALTYRNSVVPNLSFVSCTIVNSSEPLISDETLRFEFKGREDVKILDAYLDPKPEPELGVAAEPVVKQREFERKYKIGHLVKGKTVRFNFVVAAPDVSLQIHDYNPKGDVKFIERELGNRRNKYEILKTVLTINFFFLLTYPLCNVRISSQLAIDALWSILFIAVNIRYSKAVVEILHELLTEKGKRSDQEKIDIVGNNNLIVRTFENGFTKVDRTSIQSNADNAPGKRNEQ